MERSINLSFCLSIVSPAGGNFASANKPANSAVIKKLICSRKVVVIVDILDDLLEHWQFGTKEHLAIFSQRDFC